MANQLFMQDTTSSNAPIAYLALSLRPAALVLVECECLDDRQNLYHFCGLFSSFEFY